MTPKRTRNGIEYILIENIISLLYLLLVRLKNFFFMIAAVASWGVWGAVA